MSGAVEHVAKLVQRAERRSAPRSNLIFAIEMQAEPVDGRFAELDQRLRRIPGISFLGGDPVHSKFVATKSHRYGLRRCFIQSPAALRE